MRGGRRRRSPPGPPAPPGFRRDDRRYGPGPRDHGPGPRDRRPRSISPDRFRGRGSPPPFKRGRYGPRDQDDFYGPRGYDHGYYGRAPSPPPRHSRRDGPRTYKDFCRSLPDDVTPEEAQREYQLYLSEYWGSEVRADFESKKNEDWMKRRFDPRGMRKAMAERNEEALKAATGFAEDLKAGTLDPKAEDFNQGAGSQSKAGTAEAAEDENEEKKDEDLADGEEKKHKPKVPTAPQVCWKPERLMSDLELSRQLIQKLDEEKGVANNELLGTDEAGPAGPASMPEAANGNAGAKVETNAEAAEQAAENGGGPIETDTAAKVEAKEEVKEEVKEGVVAGVKAEASAEDLDKRAGKLDLQLAYLWRVHGVDYYAGKELADPMSFSARGTAARTLRGPKPEEGEQIAEADEKKSLKLVAQRIDQVWKKRLVSGDPFEASLNKEKIEKLVEDWIEDQVKHIDENKWGCKLSQKLFVGKDYVLKHVRLKHTEKVEAQRTKICDELFWENYKKFRQEEQKMMQAELTKMQQAMQMQQSGLPMPWDGSGPAPPQAAPGGEGFPGAGAFPGAGPVIRGPPMVPRPAGMMLPGAMMPQPGQVLVLAPGAGPMGPFISVPMAEAGGYGRGMGPPRGPPLHGGRGGGRGYSFPPFPGSGGLRSGRPDPRSYFDLDNPTNNRAVLDYGDL